jgi:hypothetical protein
MEEGELQFALRKQNTGGYGLIVVEAAVSLGKVDKCKVWDLASDTLL